MVLTRLAVTRAHVLAVEIPGEWLSRATLQRRLRARGWRDALTPADADVLAVCGTPTPAMADLVEQLWEQLPGPRVRIDIDDPTAADDALDRAALELGDHQRHLDDARGRQQRPHLEHGDMDHDHMAPEGIPLAGGAEDRDGLEMDVLNLRMGPVLAHWPAGLVLRADLHGDVLAAAEATFVAGATAGADDNEHAVARQCDHVVDVLALAGWRRGAELARRCRDLAIDDPNGEHTAGALHRLHRGVRRSPLLRWSLRGVARLPARLLAEHGLPAGLAGDTYDRLLARVALLADTTPELLAENPLRVPGPAVTEGLPALIEGVDLAAARLAIASLAIASLGIDTAVPAEASAQ